MKRTKWIAAGLLLTLMLGVTGCGRSTSSSIGNKSLETVNSDYSYGIIADDYSMDYDSTYVDSSYADYSYTVQASGESSKSKKDILKDYEDIQAFVKDNGGYIENVNNNYYVYDKGSDRYYYSSGNHKASGTLSFTIQIDKEYVDEVLEKLDTLCSKNNLTVTTYTQRITNYEGKKVTNNKYDYYYDYDTITKDELEKRLKYADISVKLNYYKEFNFFEKAAMGIGNAFRQFFDTFGELIQIVLVLLVIAYVLFFNVCIWYKMFRKMMYKHQKKHPDYYKAKKVELVNDDVPAKNTGLKPYKFDAVLKSEEKVEEPVEEPTEETVEETTEETVDDQSEDESEDDGFDTVSDDRTEILKHKSLKK